GIRCDRRLSRGGRGQDLRRLHPVHRAVAQQRHRRPPEADHPRSAGALRRGPVSLPRHHARRLERDLLARRRIADPDVGLSRAAAVSGWRPGDPTADRSAMLRVDQAGEYGATRIYAGQLAVLRRNGTEAKLIARMAAQEERHLKRFNALMAARRVRPTALQPMWNVAGFALGAVTALMSEKAALACTDAVET